MNPLAEALTGRPLSGAAGRPLTEVLMLSGQGEAPVPDPVARVLATEGLAAEGGSGAIRSADGRALTIEYSAAPIRDRRQRVDGVVIAFRDVTGERAMAEQVSWQATHDALTSLINRHEFERRLERALAGSREGRGDHTALLLDLDQFKIVNDTCGHAAGDELLRQITFELSNRIRLTDTLARLGGDEFGVLLAGCPLEQGVRIAESIRQAVEDFRFSWQDKVFKVGVSVGAVAVSAAHATLADILKAADAACYMAKEMGRNRIHVHSPNDGELAQRHGEMEWVSRIHKALDENRLALYYQEIRPVTGSQNGDHFELLLRMIDEKGRTVAPLTFLPAAERYHLMPAIDRWVVRTAFARLRALYGPSGTRRLHTAAVNLSGASITDENFLRYVQGLFREYRVPPRSICFEITETAAIGNLRLASEFMKQLKTLGCRFSLDDFGSGMSSFAYLKNLPVDYLKIDGGFVKDMERDPIDCAMVEAIHRVGHVMGIKTVAEFVENEAILERLAAVGVDYAQGYGVARPRPLEDLEGAAALPAAERRPRLTVVAG
jgi:diguanylate cyclase (GGDEF)-like protein